MSVSGTNRESARDNIRSQGEHHRKVDFQTEFRRFCKMTDVPVNERDVWD